MTTRYAGWTPIELGIRGNVAGGATDGGRPSLPFGEVHANSFLNLTVHANSE